jgi:hypothetical protein
MSRNAADVRRSHPGEHLNHHQIAVLLNAYDVQQSTRLGDYMSPNTQAFDIKYDQQEMDACRVP